MVVDVRKADDYNVSHIPGAYSAPGLAVLPSTDALPFNLGDCTAKKVAVPCVVPNPPTYPNHNSAAIAYCPVLSAAHAHFCLTRPLQLTDRSTAGLATWDAPPGATCVPGASNRSSSSVRTWSRWLATRSG